MYAPDQIPGGVTGLEKPLNGDVRYSAPITGGTAAANVSNSPGVGEGAVGLVEASPRPGRAQSAAT
jgi:hypothetical protein